MDHTVNQKTVSVIIPVYKVEKYINRCVDSVLRQTYTNMQIILVDDGSPDCCPEICDGYASRDSRITVIHQNNQGLSAARNTGLDNARGDFIFFIDSDDYIDKYIIQKMVRLAEEKDADLVLCNFLCVDDEGNELNNLEYNKLQNSIIDSKEMISHSIEDGSVPFIVAWNKLYRKELWQSYRYPVGKIHEDEFAFHHIVGQCKKIVSTGYTGYFYVQRDGSIMSSRTSKSCVDILDAYKDRLDWCVENGLISSISNIMFPWYFTCVDLYKREKNRLMLNKYLELADKYQEIIYGKNIPIKYAVAYRGMWYMPGICSALLILYKKLWNMAMKNH